MNAINKLKLSLSAVLFSFLGIACSDIDDNLVNYPVVAEVNTVYYIDSESEMTLIVENLNRLHGKRLLTLTVLFFRQVIVFY